MDSKALGGSGFHTDECGNLKYGHNAAHNVDILQHSTVQNKMKHVILKHVIFSQLIKCLLYTNVPFVCMHYIKTHYMILTSY